MKDTYVSIETRRLFICGIEFARLVLGVEDAGAAASFETCFVHG